MSHALSVLHLRHTLASTPAVVTTSPREGSLV